jgi:hypothetical protein
MIFCDMGVNPTQWGFCVYDEIIEKLAARGIPREQIATIGDADSDAKKQSLFDRVRSGAVRVIIGSTAKMGTGTNVQKRLVALHHLDAPWKPAEVEQRDGRILRQGNENQKVAIYRYVTEGSFDAYMWVRRESYAFDCVAWPRGLDHTCGSVRSSLSTHAPSAMTGYEAVETTYPDSSGPEHHREVISVLPASRREGARLGGMTNPGEPTINPVKAGQAKDAVKPGPKGTQSVAPLHIGSTRTRRLPGESWGLPHRVKRAEHGKPVSSPRKGQADREEGCRGCGQEISEKANAGL